MDKARFLRVYANLPIASRNEIILVLDDRGPITWNVAYLEISQETKLGEIIFKKLVEFNFI